MNWIIYAVACLFLYGIMQFFIKLSSMGGNPIVSSMIFIAAQFVAQILLGAYFISKSGLDISYGSIKYGIVGGIAAAVATILFFLALEQASLSKVVPIVNLSVVVGVLLGVLLLKDGMNYRIAAGIILAVMSIYLLTNSS
ncbi:MAG: EamA family transporter [Candidatus Methanoperedens sp.]|nr:EamA family transporter [Candidatus Methanoperedens sp.]